MANNIHQTAIVAAGAELGDNINIGPYCVVGPQVKLKDHVTLKSHVVVDGCTTIGEFTEIFPFASIGTAPQDKKYSGEDSKLIIGQNNIIREHVTINPGTSGGGMFTEIGNNCLLMVACHVAHDCHLGNNVILANNATLAGHVTIGDHAILGGLSAVHQFVRIGEHAMIGGMSAVESDIIPYGVTMNERASLIGINLVGLKRRSFSKDAITAIRSAYDALFGPGDNRTFAEKLNSMAEEYKGSKEVMLMVEFLQADTTRPICKPKAI